ncbi:MAG: hypothetical protein PVJ89_09500 [Planctomycetota bacterium]|jgi:hypothetical protein
MSGSARLGWALMLVITALHFDLWNWDSTSVVFGFMPTGLAWQAGISLAAAAGWALMMRVAWPTRVEDWASQPSGLDDASGGEAS